MKRGRSEENAIPPVASTKIIRLSGMKIRLVKPSAPNIFLRLPWDVLQTGVLPYLDFRDTMSFARIFRSWYRRFADEACKKFAVFLQQGSENLDLRGYLERVRVQDGKLTPMAIACYLNIGQVEWDKNFKLRRRITKPWDKQRIIEEVTTMLKRIAEYGSIDAFKTHKKHSVAGLDERFEAKAEKRERIFAVFVKMLRKEGYETSLRLIILKETRSIRLNHNILHDFRTNGKYDKFVLSRLHDSLTKLCEATVRKLHMPSVILALEDRGIVWKAAI